MQRTKLFFDLELTGLHKDADPISIAIVSGGGHSFYAEFNDIDMDKCSEFVKVHVLTSLEFQKETSSLFTDNKGYVRMKGNRDQIISELHKWFSLFERIEMRGFLLPFDWIKFCELFGGLLSIPTHIYNIPNDLSVLFLALRGDADINRTRFLYGPTLLNICEGMGKSIQQLPEFNSLFDAKITCACFYQLRSAYITNDFHIW